MIAMPAQPLFDTLDRWPTLFVSHGSPMFAVEPGLAGAHLRKLGQLLPKPRAVLVLSPHWMTRRVKLNAHPQPATMHDFGGFPQELYGLQYPAKGSPDVAQEVVELLAQHNVPGHLAIDQGLDHGVWVPLMHLFPQADVPVMHVAFPTCLNPEQANTYGRYLRPLREQGVLIVGSGSLTHNLRDFFHGVQHAEELEYVEAFSGWVARTLAAGDRAALLAYRRLAPDAARAHPTDEHLLPLMFAAGAVEDGQLSSVLRLQGEAVGQVLQMDSFLFDAPPALREAMLAA